MRAKARVGEPQCPVYVLGWLWLWLRTNLGKDFLHEVE